MVSASNSQIAYRWLFYETFPVAFIGTLFLHFNYLLSGKPLSKIKKIILRTFYFTSLFICILVVLKSEMLYANANGSNYLPYFGEPGPLYPFHTLNFLIPTILGNVELFSLYTRSHGVEKKRLEYFVWGTILGYIGGGSDWLPAYKVCIPILNPFGLYTVPLYTILTSYAILQHKLFDIHLVIRKSLVYSILVTGLTVSYFGLVYLVEAIFRTTMGYHSVKISLAAFALTALAFQPLKLGIQRLVDWLIFRVPQEELVKRMERLEQEARQTEKLRTVATLAAGLSHELRNPLQLIRTYAEILPERFADLEFQKKCSEIFLAESARIIDLLNQLMDFAKPKLPSFKKIEPERIIGSTLDMLNDEFSKHQIELEKQFNANGVHIQADSNQLRQVVLNLIINALEAVGPHSKVTVSTSQKDGWFTLEVSDTGPGIDPKILPTLFEPFTTTKPSGNGLGLSIVHSIVREHRGKLSVQSQPGQGTTFTIKFPLG